MDLHPLRDACFELALELDLTDLINLISGKKEAIWLAELLSTNEQDGRKEAYCLRASCHSKSIAKDW